MRKTGQAAAARTAAGGETRALKDTGSTAEASTIGGRALGAALIVLSAASFGAMAIFARFAYRDGVSLPTLLTLRFGIAAVLLHGIVALRGLRLPTGRTLVALMVLGGVGYVAQSTAYFKALTLAPAGLVALLLYLNPGFVSLLSAITGRERLTKIKVVALLLAGVGSALTIGGADLTGSGRGLAVGIGFAFAAAAIYAIYIVASAKVTAQAGAVASSAVIVSAAAVVFAIPATVGGLRPPQTWVGWLSVLAIALISTVLAIITFFGGMSRVGPTSAATMSSVEPVVTVTLAAIVLAEPLRTAQLVGGALILGAVLLLVRAKAPTAVPAGTPPAGTPTATPAATLAATPTGTAQPSAPVEVA